MLSYLLHLLSSPIVPKHDLPPELWDKELMQWAIVPLSSDYWLRQWPYSPQPTPRYQVPITASLVHTPLCTPAWYSMLISLLNGQLVKFTLYGIQEGFCIGFTKQPSSLNSAKHNLKGPLDHPEVVSDYLGQNYP